MVVFKYKSGELIGVNAVGFSITNGLYTLIGEDDRVINGNLKNVVSITIDGAKVYSCMLKEV